MSSIKGVDPVNIFTYYHQINYVHFYDHQPLVFLLQLLCDSMHFVITYWLFNYQYMTAHSGSKVSVIRTELHINITPYHV